MALTGALLLSVSAQSAVGRPVDAETVAFRLRGGSVD